MGGKILAVVITMGLLLTGAVVLYGVLPMSGLEEGEALGITIHETGSEVEGIRLEPEGYSWGTKQDPPVLIARWSNKGEEEFVYGAGFDVLYLEKDEWKSCLRGESLFVDDIGYLLKAGEQNRHEYSLEAFDMSRTGDYRFQVCPDGENLLWIDFSLKYAE